MKKLFSLVALVFVLSSFSLEASNDVVVKDHLKSEVSTVDINESVICLSDLDNNFQDVLRVNDIESLIRENNLEEDIVRSCAGFANVAGDNWELWIFLFDWCLGNILIQL